MQGGFSAGFLDEPGGVATGVGAGIKISRTSEVGIYVDNDYPSVSGGVYFKQALPPFWGIELEAQSKAGVGKKGEFEGETTVELKRGLEFLIFNLKPRVSYKYDSDTGRGTLDPGLSLIDLGF